MHPAASSVNGTSKRELRGTGLRLDVRKRCVVRSDHVVGKLGRRRTLDHEADRQIRILLGEIPPCEKSLRDPASEQAGVEDRKRANTIGVLHGPPQTDRAAPVLNDHDRVVQIEALKDL